MWILFTLFKLNFYHYVTACPLLSWTIGTAVDGPTDSRCSSDSMGSVSIPHGLGCYDGQRRGALTNYQCDKWYALSGGSSRTCMGDGVASRSTLS